MGFFTLLKSLDELLYEVMSWLIFYPVTLWRSLARPQEMMNYADIELGDQPDQQYTDTLTPPLFLLLTLILSHGIELATVGQSPIVASKVGLDAVVGDDTNLLVLRLATFSVFPLIMAARLVRQQKQRLDRDTLRPPFYSQCYVTAPFALVLGIAGILLTLKPLWCGVAGLVLGAIALLWYGLLQTRWFARHLGVSLLRGWWEANIAMIQSLALVTLVAALFS